MLALSPEMKEAYEASPASHLYISAIEHPSVRSAGRFPARAVSEIPVTGDGVVDVNALRALLEAHDQASGRAMIAVMAVNSETVSSIRCMRLANSQPNSTPFPS